jgi:hypothetical protein
MVEIREQTDIRATADEIFSVIVDLRGYDRWLPASKAFSGNHRHLVRSHRPWERPMPSQGTAACATGR